MKKIILNTLYCLILIGCSGISTSEENTNPSIISEIQYLGEDEGFINDLKKNNVKIEVINNIKNSSDDYSYIFIDEKMVNTLTKDEIQDVLNHGFKVFILNVDNTKQLSEIFLSSPSFETSKDGKPNIVQIFIKDGNLAFNFIGVNDNTAKEVLYSITKSMN